MRTRAYGATTDRFIRNFKRLEIEAICPLLSADVYTTVTLVGTEPLLKRIIGVIIYLLCKVGKVAKFRNPRAVREQIHFLDFKILEIVRVFVVTARKCSVRYEYDNYLIGQNTRKNVVKTWSSY